LLDQDFNEQQLKLNYIKL